MSAKHKVSGFFTALILAVVSYLVMFFFVPDFAKEHLGVSFGKDKAQTVISEVSDSITSIKLTK